MLAKLYFDSGWSAQTDLLPVIAAVIGGATDVNSITGATSKFTPALSYILTTKNASGWTQEFANNQTKVFSAPCKDSTKKKLMRLNAPNSGRITMFTCEGFNASTGVAVGAQSYDEPSAACDIIYSGVNNSTPHWTGGALEVWISASARHCVVAANQPGYSHGVAMNAGRSGGWVVGVFEHTPADSWLTDNSPYIPAVVMSSLGNTASSGANAITMYRNRSRNISLPTATDITGTTDGARMYMYTKYGQGTLANMTLAGTNNVLVDQNSAVKVLLPFGVRSKEGLVRGGAISELSDVYLAPAGIFKENLQIQVGENTANRYVIFSLGFNGSTSAGYGLAVPRG